MPNNLDSNVSQKVLKKFLPGFMSDLVLCKTVDRQLLAGEINSDTGDSVSFKRPHQFSSLRTAGGDISGQTKNNLISGKATGTVSNYITVAVEWSQIEQALELNQLDQILAPVKERMVTDLETELAQFMLKNGALSLGTPGEQIDLWSDVAQTASFMKDLGIKGDNYAAIDPWAAQNLADAQNGLNADANLVRTAWEEAMISKNFGGIKALMSNGLASRTQGAFGGTLTVSGTPTVTYSAVKDTYQFSVTLTGATASVTGLLKAGDQLRFNSTYWLNQQSKQVLYKGGSGAIAFTATVLADADSDVSGNVTVTLSGVPIYDTTNPQYNAVQRALADGDSVSVIGTASQSIKPSLFYNKFFCGLGTIPLPKLHSTDSAVATYEGFSIRAHKYSDGDANKQMMRFDILPAFVCFNPHMGGQFFGKA
ncbi:P22 phage major capsid protein family protein [Vibrio diazotrophicus]|uniref:P22 phage major capsid protein family protein n=1 Tax=Vibrio diazotrophicus TaxID=685 RepID=UPI0015E0E4A1|nr:P22 phage major capsid protein family protein [Vibrio diazotrophicus]